MVETVQELVRLPGGDMLFEKNLAIPMPDGAVLRANVFRPAAEGRRPVILA